jgi:hypothetical protein
MFRVEGVLLDGLTEEVTRAVELGASVKDVDSLMNPEPEGGGSKSAKAAELILDLLESSPMLEMESDELDGAVAQAVKLAPKTVQNIRSGLRKKGLIRSRPELSETGQPERWFVVRTAAPRL